MSIKNPYFVILNGQNGSAMPMVDDDENLAMYETELGAHKAGFNNQLGRCFGFEVFELGNGCHYFE